MLLGVNYSGMHDAAVALLTETGELVSAVSEERLSRVKKAAGSRAGRWTLCRGTTSMRSWCPIWPTRRRFWDVIGWSTTC